MEIIIVRTSVTKAALTTMTEQQFGDMVKAVVDIDHGIMAIGGELHSDEEALLLAGCGKTHFGSCGHHRYQSLRGL